MRLYLAVTFWGDEYRRYFVDYCLASLLAPGNIPAIADRSSARLLIATTDRDWAELQGEPAFAAVQTFIAVEHLPFIGTSDVQGRRMFVMSEGHRLLARRMFADRAQGVFIYPDMIAAKGFLAAIERLWRQKFAAVMFMNVRFANEGIFEELKAGVLLVVSPRELVRLTLRHMHSEMQRSGFDNPFDDYGSSSYFWNVTRGEDVVFHCGSWIPSLIDYARLNAHDDSTLATWTLDGDYVSKNFPDEKKIYYARDTDELFMISFTPESREHYSLAPLALYRIPFLRTGLKIVGAHNFLYEQAPAWLREEEFRLPVRFRGGDSPEQQWLALEAHAARIVGRMRHGGSIIWKLSYFLYFRFVPIVSSLWPNRKVIARRFLDILRGDRAAWNRVRWRVRQQITGESTEVWEGRHQTRH
ncbi:MAG: hypothetical protein ABWZ64_18065 [Xanthobacteraceae bacterium]|jgi:hypothetical protein